MNKDESRREKMISRCKCDNFDERFRGVSCCRCQLVNALQALVHVLGFGVSRQSSARQFLMQEFANTETVENPNVLTMYKKNCPLKSHRNMQRSCSNDDLRKSAEINRDGPRS
ncbi:hypothetical protein V1478_002692 [Vespula squamosa]|uniref:Uncharacterized protein n=1 Tax=Vespula squamosa TaxID=30214 RepID=A0ABD2BUR1_VESSQ